MAWLKGLLGLFNLAGFFARWFGRRERDRLIIKAESARRAEDALKAADKALKDRHAIEDKISRTPAGDNRDRLRKWAKRDN